jgi:hypothetical protein
MANAQGFSQSAAAIKAVSGLQSTVNDLEGQTKKTEAERGIEGAGSVADTAKGKIQIFAADSAEALEMLGTKADRVTAAMEKLTNTEWKVNLKGIEEFRVGDRDLLDVFATAVEERGEL